MAGNRNIQGDGELVLDVTVSETSQEKAKADMQAAFAKLQANVQVDAVFDSKKIKAAFKVAADKAKLSVGVSVEFDRKQIQTALVASAAGLSIPVIADVIVDNKAARAQTTRLAREYQLLASAAQDSPAARRQVIQGVNQRVGAFAAASQRMRQLEQQFNLQRVQDAARAAQKLDEIDAQSVQDRKRRLGTLQKAQAERVNARLKDELNAAAVERDIDAEQRKADIADGARQTKRLDQLIDERRKNAFALQKIDEDANAKERVERTKTNELKKRSDDAFLAATEANREKLVTQAIAADTEVDKRSRISSKLTEDYKDVIGTRANEARITRNNSALRKMDEAEQAFALRGIDREIAIAQRKEVIQAQLDARLLASETAFEQRRTLASEREARKLAARASQPILQTVLIDANKLNASLADFDRVITRALRTSLLAFTAWSAGVTAVVGAAAGAALVSFAKLEAATARASAVFAGGAYAKALEQGTATTRTFGDEVARVSDEVQQASKDIALQTLFNPTDIAKGFQSAAAAGLDYKDALAGLLPISQFAQNEQLDINESVELLTGSLNAAGKSGGKALQLLADQFTQVGNSSNATAKDVADAFSNQAAAAFNSYGQSAEQALEIINLFGKVNQRGLAAGTQTAILIREINNAAFNKAPKAFEKYGIALTDANGQAVPFVRTLGQLGVLFKNTERARGNEGVAKLRKELGLTEKSLRGLITILPQVQKLGAEGLERQVALIERAGGSVARQSKPIQDTISFQFQQTLENVQNLFSTFGKGASEELKSAFDAFNGPGGIISQLTPQVSRLGDQFGDLVGRFAAFTQSAEARNGAAILVDAIRITLVGVRDAFAEFSSAFDDANGAQSTFESIAQSIRGFATVSATVLPVVARILGQIFDYLIDNADAFETFAKFTLVIYALRKAFTLLLNPLGQALIGIDKLGKALALTAAGGTAGPVINTLTAIGQRFGFLAKQATVAQIAIDGLTAAEARNVSAQTGVALAGGAADASRAGRVATSGRGLSGLEAATGAAELGTARSLAGRVGNQQKAAKGFAAALNFANPVTSKFAKILAAVEGTFGRLIPAFVKATPVLGGLAAGLARFAGPLALVVAGIELAIGFVKGFVSELTRGKDGTGDFANSLRELQPIFDALKVAGQIILDILATVGRVGASIGRAVGGLIRDYLSNIADGVRGIKLLFEGDLIGALKAFADVITNTLTSPFRAAIGLIIDLVADAISPLEYADKLLRGSPIKDLGNSVREAADNVRDFRLNLSEAGTAAEQTSAATDEIAASGTRAGEAVQSANERIVASQALTQASIDGIIVSLGSAAVAQETYATGNREIYAQQVLVTEGFLAASDALTGLSASAVDAITPFAQATFEQQGFAAASALVNDAQVQVAASADVVNSSLASTASTTGTFAVNMQTAGTALDSTQAALSSINGAAQLAGQSLSVVGTQFGNTFLSASAQANEASRALQDLRTQSGETATSFKVDFTGVDTTIEDSFGRSFTDAAALAETANARIIDSTGAVVRSQQFYNGLLERKSAISFNAFEAAGVTAANAVSGAFDGTVAQLAAVEGSILRATAALSAGVQLSIESQGIIAATQNLLSSEDPTQRAIGAQVAEAQRQQALINAAERARSDSKIINDALGPVGFDDPAAPKKKRKAAAGSTPKPKQREFIDPDDAIQEQIDRLKPTQKVAQVSALIAKAFGEAGTKYQLTRRQTLLLADAQPRLEKALERQKGKVDKLNESLEKLRNTQLAGTKAATDAQFAFDQQTNALELQQVQLKIGGATDEDPRVKEIQKQIDAIALQAQAAELTANLQLDPARKRVDDTLNPVTELGADDIIAQFQKISAQRDVENTKLAQQEALQTRLNDALDVSKKRYDLIDQANQKSVEAYNKAQQAAAQTARSVASVGASAAAATTSVKTYSGAVEAVPSGKGVVDKSLKGINDQVAKLTPQFQGAGRNVMLQVTRGINQGYASLASVALTSAISKIGTTLSAPYLNPNAGVAYQAGRNIMHGFQTGMITRSGINADGTSSFPKGSLAEYLHVTIPEWIRKNKGPVSYDATILVPAGQAVMDGFGKGLKQGFGEIQGFVKDVGPSLRDYISGDDFSARIAPIMAGVKLGGRIDSSDVNAALADLRADVDFSGAGLSGFAGVSDPSLGFLHKVLSEKDTELQALQIVKSLGNGSNFNPNSSQFLRPAGTLTSSGKPTDHSFGTAADIGSGSARPTATSLHLFDVAKQLLGTVFRQVIHNGRGYNAGGGSFPDNEHFDHVHLGWLKGKGFDRYSGKLGEPLATDIPGAPPIVDAAISKAARAYGASLPGLAAVAKAESGFRIGAINDYDINAQRGIPSKGLFQFIEPTFDAFSAKAIAANAEAWKGVPREWLDPFAQSLSAAWGFTHGKAGDWATAAKYFAAMKNFGGMREGGGPVQSGKSYIVGEKRPEIFVPNRSGMILPDAAATMSGGSGSYTDARQFNVTTAATDPQAVADVIEARSKRRLTGKSLRR